MGENAWIYSADRWQCCPRLLDRPGAGMLLTAESDISWSADKKLHGWTLPQTARLLKLWGVRHIRWMWLTNQVYQAADRWAAMGIGFGGPNQYDRWVLYAIYRGWA